MHPYDKFKVCSFTYFGDMFQGVTHFIRVAWLRLGPFLKYYFSILEKLFIYMMHPHAKFQVSSFTRFGDIFERVPNFIRVTWPRPRPFSTFLFLLFSGIVLMYPFAKFQFSRFTAFGDMFEGLPNFIRVTWPRPRPFFWNFICPFWRNCSYASACQISSL